jgi:hypothetical protein
VAIRYLLDTNIVSFHIRESSAALRRRLRRVDASTVALSVVTEMEIRRRIRGLRVVDWTRWRGARGQLQQPEQGDHEQLQDEEIDRPRPEEVEGRRPDGLAALVHGARPEHQVDGRRDAGQQVEEGDRAQPGPAGRPAESVGFGAVTSLPAEPRPAHVTLW